MIPLKPEPEPPEFDASVRRPGLHFLRRVPKPTAAQFKSNNFWKHALRALRAAYGDICAYSALWVPNSGTVDHFHPKNAHPFLAYEWSNYRLADAKINGYKGDSTEILDPFYIQHGWFTLDFATLFVKAEPTLDSKVIGAVETTIAVLRLNGDALVQMRFEIFTQYCRGGCTMDLLKRYYPFLASELARQQVRLQ